MLPSPRLAALFGEIAPCTTLCDIGCDHGLLPLEALMTDRCQSVVLADISAKSLAKAVRKIEEKGYGSRAARYVTDGFSAIAEPVDQALICGMGGREIIGILSRGGEGQRPARLILQPMRQVAEVRRYLVANGYDIIRDYIVESEGKFYDVIVCQASRAPRALTPAEQSYGRTNLEDRGADFMRCIAKRMAKVRSLLLRSLPDQRRKELKQELTEMEGIAHGAE